VESRKELRSGGLQPCLQISGYLGSECQWQTAQLNGLKSFLVQSTDQENLAQKERLGTIQLPV